MVSVGEEVQTNVLLVEIQHIFLHRRAPVFLLVNHITTWIKQQETVLSVRVNVRSVIKGDVCHAILTKYC